MKAVILAGGIGSRLRPLTFVVPKVLLPLGGRPLIDHTINYLREYGFNEIILCVAYLKQQIKEHLGDGARLGVKVEYAEADEPLGTSGQLATAARMLSETFLAINGDIATTLNLRKLVEYHRSDASIATVALKKFTVDIPYGYVTVNSDNSRITGFEEKPTLTYMANAGIYVFEPEILQHLGSVGKVVSLERDVFPKLISGGYKLKGYFQDAFWSDVGTLADLEKADKQYTSKELL